MSSIIASIQGYELWLRDRLGGEVVEPDLARKHDRMRKSAFLFLRATCWRWAELAGTLSPELMDAPAVQSVGDAHVGNFGLWRDAEARLVWGVNDFDEAASGPYALDLVRLCASAVLASGETVSIAECATAILDGYARGREEPKPFVLETRHLWLRDLFAAPDDMRAGFWTKLQALAAAGPAAPERYGAVLAARLPLNATGIATAPRQAGVGSLGRPRYVAVAEVRGAPVAREVKRLVPSCWDRMSAPGAGLAVSTGRFRSPDPWLSAVGDLQVRRLAPDSRKLDLGEDTPPDDRLLRAMGREIAAIQLDREHAAMAIAQDLARRPASWLADASRRAVEANQRDWTRFRDG